MTSAIDFTQAATCTPVPGTDQIPTVQFRHLTKKYKQMVALDDVSLDLEPGKVYGLLGRNGAGKTTLMSILDAQSFPTSGTVRVGGVNPAESWRAVQQVCFIRENQKYPDEATAPSVLKTASWFYPNWDTRLAERLMVAFSIPRKTVTKKLSRGQASALSATFGLASRAPITVFDEPYLGLDATARELFYRTLMEDLEFYPRTILISSHLVDEIANLIDHVLLLDHGRLILNESTETLMGRAFALTGPTALVAQFCERYEVLKTETLGGVSRYEILGEVSEVQRAEAIRQGLTLAPLPLQSLSTAIASSQVSLIKEEIAS